MSPCQATDAGGAPVASTGSEAGSVEGFPVLAKGQNALLYPTVGFCTQALWVSSIDYPRRTLFSKKLPYITLHDSYVLRPIAMLSLWSAREGRWAGSSWGDLSRVRRLHGRQGLRHWSLVLQQQSSGYCSSSRDAKTHFGVFHKNIFWNLPDLKKHTQRLISPRRVTRSSAVPPYRLGIRSLIARGSGVRILETKKRLFWAER